MGLESSNRPSSLASFIVSKSPVLPQFCLVVCGLTTSRGTANGHSIAASSWMCDTASASLIEPMKLNICVTTVDARERNEDQLQVRLAPATYYFRLTLIAVDRQQISVGRHKCNPDGAGSPMIGI